MSRRYRGILQVALAANTVMFAVELIGGLHANSVSLIADAVDFAGDAANYGLSLAVLSMAAVWRSRAALIKGLSMGGYGAFVLVHALWNFVVGSVPEPAIMGVIGALALVVNVAVAGMLYAYREGDANMRSVWLCSRNDAIGNIAVIVAAGAVTWLHTGWPDVFIALLMGSLALLSACSVVRQARSELVAYAQTDPCLNASRFSERVLAEPTCAHDFDRPPGAGA